MYSSRAPLNAGRKNVRYSHDAWTNAADLFFGPPMTRSRKVSQPALPIPRSRYRRRSPSHPERWASKKDWNEVNSRQRLATYTRPRKPYRRAQIFSCGKRFAYTRILNALENGNGRPREEAHDS
jgi:hypothetical protein